MKVQTVRKLIAGEPTEYLLCTEGSVTAKIYSSKRQANGGTYAEHSLVYTNGTGRVRKRFSDLGEARAAAQRALFALLNGQTKALTLDNAEAQEYAIAVEELKTINVSLLPAIREYRAALEMLKGKALLIEAVRYYMASGVTELVRKTVPDAVAEMLADKQKDRRSDEHLTDLKYRLGRFAKDFPGEISEVTKGQVTEWLRNLGLSPRSRNNFAATITTFFRWAASDEKRYLPPGKPTAAEKLPRAEETDEDSEDVVIYSPAEVAAILTRIKVRRPELLPFVAIGAFAGLRTAEIERLEWEQVDFEQGHIEIKKGRAKTRTRRLVPILPALAKWIGEYKDRTGPVCPFARTQHLAQLEVERASPEFPAIDWKRNGLRHSFGTYRLADIKDENQVALEMGNSPQLIFQNYRGIVTMADGREYWAT